MHNSQIIQIALQVAARCLGCRETRDGRLPTKGKSSPWLWLDIISHTGTCILTYVAQCSGVVVCLTAADTIPLLCDSSTAPRGADLAVPG